MERVPPSKRQTLGKRPFVLLLDTVISQNYPGVSESHFAKGRMSGEDGGVGGP